MPTVTITGQSAVAYAGNLRIFSSDWYNFYYEQYQGVESIGNAYTQTESQEATSSLGISVVTGTENCSVIISGIESQSGFESIIANGEIYATVNISGLALSATINPVTATEISDEIWSSGKIQRYPANAFKNSSVKLSGIVAQNSQNDISASGTIQIDATISLNNVVSFSQIANINADGILSISDEEIILLMAA